MDNKISEKQKTDEENKNVRLTDEEKVKLFEEFLSEHPGEKITSKTVYKGYNIGTYVIQIRQKIVYKKGYCSEEVRAKLQELGLLYEKRDSIEQKVENLAQYCRTNPYAFSRNEKQIPESLQKDYDYVRARRSRGKLSPSIEKRLENIKLGGVFGFLESDKELLKQGKISEQGLIQIYEEFNSMEEFKNAYVEYLVDMANLRKNEDEMIKSRKENELHRIKAELQEKHQKIIRLKQQKVINMQNFYNINVPYEYIDLYQGVFGYLDDGFIFDENTRKLLDKIINRLPEKYMELLKNRYGIDGRERKTLNEIAIEKKVCTQYISSENSTGVRKMRVEAFRQNLSKSKNIAGEEFIREYFKYVDVFSHNDNNHLPEKIVQKLSESYRKRVKKLDPKEINKNTSIFLLDLSKEASDCLEKAGIVSVEDVINIDERKIEDLKQIDSNAIEEILSMIKKLKEILGKNEKPENMKIEELNFSMRTYNALKRNGINTVQELIDTPAEKISTIPNIGGMCLNEINAVLRKKGLKLEDKNNVPDKNTQLEIQNKKADEIKLEEVGLQFKYYRRLRLGGIETLHQLLDKTDEELLSINGLGKTALKEIKNELVKLGYLNKEEECNKEEELEQRRIRIAELKKKQKGISSRMKEQAKEISQMVNGRVDSNTIQLIQEASETLAQQQQELDNILGEINKLECPEIPLQENNPELQNSNIEIEEEEQERE